ncbi:hypothetical protein KSP40_PGU007531 [Platanthera guangdongensis]|uniref:Uncharacterized protein n=1 Tax=Platanthera guangdongensis TaxID=2320717 RepID=A0ABR2MHE3_9ASPA
METTATDYILVPLGFIIMAGYHVWLLHRIIHCSIIKPIARFNSVRNHIPAMDLVMATMVWAAIMLGSSAAFLMANAHCMEQLVRDDREMPGRAGTSHAAVMKFFCLAAYLLAAFLLSMRTGRYHRRAGLLVIAVQAR